MSQRRTADDIDVVRSEAGVSGSFSAQDWLIVFEALVQWAGPPADEARGTTQTPREQRAWDLIDAIAVDLDLPPEELPRQIDEQYAGPEARR